jgi:hypothetical protein
MGGKRYDQYQIDPAEAGATDYKTLPQTGRGHSNLDDTVDLDRQRVAQSEHDDDERGQPFPSRSRPPTQDANRPLRADRAHQDESDEEPQRIPFDERPPEEAK